MDELINRLYKHEIIIIKNINLKNNEISPLYIDFNKLFQYKSLLNLFLEQINDYISKNINFDNLLGIDNLSKSLCTLLYYKYNYNNIINNTNNVIHNLDDNFKSEILLLKENYGLSENSRLKFRGYNVNNIFFLVKYGVIKNINIKSYYFLDTIYILSLLYTQKILSYEKYIDNFKIIHSNLDCSNCEINIKNMPLKSKIIFDTNLIENLKIKDFIKTLDYVCPHISLIKINLNKYPNNIYSIIKLLIHHNIIIIDKMDHKIMTNIKDVCINSKKSYNNFIINLINIEYFLTKITYDPNLDHLIYDNISTPEFQNIRLKILNQYKQQSRIIGFITKQHEYIFENKLKICYHDSENTLEKKILILNYDLIIVNNPTNLITTKNLLNNLLSNFK
jgi:hypothetical protein